MSHARLLVGCAAGFGGDRVDAASPVVETLIGRGGASVLMFEMLAERTLAQAQLARQADPEAGYAPLMEAMVVPVLERCVKHCIPIVSNFGAANPRAAARRLQTLAQRLGLDTLKIAVVEGDDLSDASGQQLLKPYLDPAWAQKPIVSANVYLGGEAIASALRMCAHIVVTGRVADPALVTGPTLAHFGWYAQDWDRLARATMAGHLLECGAQVTGGYFADPGLKEVPDLHRLGYPIAEIDDEGGVVIGKASGTGGLVNCQTVKEQLLYEIQDPAAYLTPDVVADISQAEVYEAGPNRVALTGVRGHPRPATLKVMVCTSGGWLGEGDISYAGPNATARARLAAEIIQQRVGQQLALRYDLIGVLSVFGDDAGRFQTEVEMAARGAAGTGTGTGLRTSDQVRDVRLRIAGRHDNRAVVEAFLREITALYTCGPAGGGGIRTALQAQLHSATCFVPRDLVQPTVTFI